MKVITRAVLDLLKGEWVEEDAFEYTGPIARCMPDAMNLGDIVVYPMIPAASEGSAPTTAATKWIDCSQFIGDLLFVVNIGSNTGGYGSITAQLQSGTDYSGAGAANETLDPRNSGLLTITANGTFAMAYDVNLLANKFVGLAFGYATISASVMSAELIARKRTN